MRNKRRRAWNIQEPFDTLICFSPIALDSYRVIAVPYVDCRRLVRARLPVSPSKKRPPVMVHIKRYGLM